MPLESLQECPLCKTKGFRKFLVCKDFTATNETFELQQCDACDFVFTNPRPDLTSISKYYESERYISHTGSSSGLIDSLYLIARNFTLRRKKKLVEQYSGGPAVLLDYGCGTGDFLKTCQANGWKVYGIEPSSVAHAKATSRDQTIVLKSLEELPELKFDAITLWHVLEHVGDLELKITQLKNLLTENGTLFVAVPNRTSYDAGIYKERWAAYDVPRHLWHFSEADIRRLAKNAELSIIQTNPMKLDAYYVSLLSQKYSAGKFTLGGGLRAVGVAFLSNLKARKTNAYSSLIYIIKK